MCLFLHIYTSPCILIQILHSHTYTHPYSYLYLQTFMKTSRHLVTLAEKYALKCKCYSLSEKQKSPPALHKPEDVCICQPLLVLNFYFSYIFIRILNFAKPFLFFCITSVVISIFVTIKKHFLTRELMLHYPICAELILWNFSLKIKHTNLNLSHNFYVTQMRISADKR